MHGRLSTHTNYSFLRARGGGKPLTLAMHCALCTMHCALIMYRRWWEVTHTYYAPSTRELLTLSIEFRDFKNPKKWLTPKLSQGGVHGLKSYTFTAFKSTGVQLRNPAYFVPQYLAPLAND